MLKKKNNKNKNKIKYLLIITIYSNGFDGPIILLLSLIFISILQYFLQKAIP